MRSFILPSALILAATLIPAQAYAAAVTFSGSGTVTGVAGRLTPTDAAPLGSAFTFRFSFDPDTASLIEQDDRSAAYELPVSGFSATLGGYAFPLDPDPAFAPVVTIGRGFAFFGNPFSEPSLSYTFFLPGTPVVGDTGTTPFPLSAGSRGTLAISAQFRADPNGTLVSIADLRDPGTAAFRRFSYSARDLATRRSGALSGSYVGGFASVSAVPEPASWTMMIVGTGLVGGALRRRRGDRRIGALQPG